MTLTACSESPQGDASAPTPTFQPTTTEVSIPAKEAPATIAITATPEAVVTPTAVPQPAATVRLTPTATPESTATATPSPNPTPTATPVATPTEQPTQQPTPTVAPTSTAIPTPKPTPAPTATPHPTLTPVPDKAAGTRRGITLAAENRCSEYDSDDYPYSASVEPRIVAELGGILWTLHRDLLREHQGNGH